MATYANGIPVSETTAERYYKVGPIDLREAFRAGSESQARHCQEDVPEHLRIMVNLVRTLATRPGAGRRSPEALLEQALCQFRDRSLDAWTA